MEVINWGLISTANIANKNVRAMKLSRNTNLVAVASRSVEKAALFAQENDLGESVKLYATYQELLDDPNVHAVYLPLPTKMHVEWAIKVANAKKHLLIEKPAALNAAELVQIIAACRSNGVVFMDGVMFMHHDRLDLLRSCLKDPFAGEVHRVNSSFSFNGTQGFVGNNIRTSADGDPLGALGDLGWYCIRLGLVAFSEGRDLEEEGIRMPLTCVATCSSWANEVVPLECDATVYFDKDRKKKLHFDCSFLLPFRQKYEISALATRKATSDKVYTCDDFVIPAAQEGTSFVRESSGGPASPLTDCDCSVMSKKETYAVKNKKVDDIRNVGQGQEQEVNMFSSMSLLVDTLRAGEKGEGIGREVIYWQEISLATQLVVDACMVSMLNGGAEVAVGRIEL